MAQSKDQSDDVINFCWGKKRGIGGAKRNIQFYESFMIDDLKYSLYDFVYLYTKEGSEPYIGKLLKIWEQPNSKKRVKILWFFRPSEIQIFLGDYVPLENEIFMACGDGIGLYNINPLEAIAGKCSVICTSKDERNRQPSKEELETADYIFCRTFDIQNYSISEKIDDKIADVEAKFLLNQEERNLGSLPRLAFNVHEGGGEASKSSSNPHTLCQSNAKNILEDKMDTITQPSPISAERVDVLEGKEPVHTLEEKVGSKPTFARDGEGGACVAENTGNDPELGKLTSIVPEDRLSKRMRHANDTMLSSSDLQNGTVTKKPKLEPAVNGSSRKIVQSRNESSDEIKTTQIKGKPMDLSSPSIENDKTKPSKDMQIDTVPRKVKLKSDGGRSLGNDTQLHTKISDRGKLTQRKTESLDISAPSPENHKKPSCQLSEVTWSSNTDRSKWFKEQPWDVKLRKAADLGTLVFVENLDPSYTSSEVEDIMHHITQETCTARVIQQTAFQNPNYGQAYAIFKTSIAAERAVSKANDECILLPNGSPIICSRGILKVPGPSMFGNLSIDKVKLQMQREDKAVSTAHCSQPNTIEYEMALDWILAQERSSICFKELHKGQAYEQRQIKKSNKTR